MSQIQKLIDRLLCTPRDFTWDELIKVLAHFGYKEFKKGKTGGSRRKFVNAEQHAILLHKPHPTQIMKRYQLEQVVETLREKGMIKHD